MLFRADSLASTHAVAAVLAGLARPGDVIVLAGDMGAGKTAFAQGFGRALGVTEPITSPTFTLVHSYKCGKITFHHVDLYRLERMTEVADLALAELAEFGGIVVVEWGDVVAASLGDHLVVRLEPVEGDEEARSHRSRAVRLDVGAPLAPTVERAGGLAMLILGIETATEQVSVAIGGHEGVISTFEVARGRRHAEILAPAIEFMCRQTDIELCEFGCIAVDVGPGLFTGMRVGLAAGKALAQALRIPMIGISSLDLLAFPHRHTDRVVVPVIDARKGEVFWAMYRQVPGGVQQVAAPTVGPVDELDRRPAGAQPGGPVRRRRRDPLPRRDPRRLSLRVRQLGPSVGGAAGAARPCPCATRGVGEPPRHRADLPAPPRCPDQLGRREGHDDECARRDCSSAPTTSRS